MNLPLLSSVALLALWVSPLLTLATPGPAGAAVYYVSSESGDDGDDGLTPGTAFRTLTHVGTLTLAPGDEVRLFCGERWRTEPLVLVDSGTPAAPIVITSHPLGCGDKPVLSGAQPISGWTPFAGNIYRADLDAGANAGLFALGLNQLFRGPGRLPMGRWPNIEGHADGGWAEIDAQPAGNQLVDAELPALDWTGAVAHVKGIRWYILNRVVAATSGSTLMLAEDAQCWNGCAGWGYFLNNHLATLDREGEWFWDEATNQVYLYTQTGAPADGEIEGSAILQGASEYYGAIVLGRHLQEHIGHVTIENLRLERWFDAGITTPVNLEADQNHDLVIRDNEIVDVDGTGIRLTTWVWDAANHGNGPNGWRGGRDLLVTGNVVDGANHFGIDTYSTDAEFSGNDIRDVALIANLGRSGMGCGFAGTNCTENGDGMRIKFDPGSPEHTGRNNLLRRNRLERIGMNGVDVFGRFNTLDENVIREACISKGDCGGVRTFGSGNLASTPVRDVVLTGNVIVDTLGNTDGCHPDFDPLFGFGIYIDNFSRDVIVTGNTVVGSTIVGVLFQRSTGEISNNVLYNNASATPWGAQINLPGAETLVSLTGNVLFSLGAMRWTLRQPDLSRLTASDGNYFFSPWVDRSLWVDTLGGAGLTLAEWQTASGFDAGSVDHWYTRSAGEAPRSQVLVNDTAEPMAVALGSGWVDLDQQPVGSPVMLAPFSSLVVVGPVDAIFADGFESGDLGAWSSASL